MTPETEQGAYEPPELEVLAVEPTDIVCASGTDDDEGTWTPWV